MEVCVRDHLMRKNQEYDIDCGCLNAKDRPILRRED